MSAVAVNHAGFEIDQRYFTRMAILLAVLILFAFAQFSLRGMVSWQGAPWLVHLHGIAMIGWLSVFVIQNRLAEQGKLELHRRLGRCAVVLAATIVLLGCAVGIEAIGRDAVPPFFSHAYFLGLTQLEAVGFGGFVLAAVWHRRDTQAHRRLMFGGLILITEPAFGRLLPMPYLDGWGGWLTVVCQLALLVALALHDRRLLGRVHWATTYSALAVVGVHGLVEFGATTPFMTDLAARIAVSG